MKESNKTNIGVQLYPVVLLIGAIGFAVLKSPFLSAFCFGVSFAIWAVLWADISKKD